MAFFTPFCVRYIPRETFFGTTWHLSTPTDAHLRWTNGGQQNFSNFVHRHIKKDTQNFTFLSIYFNFATILLNYFVAFLYILFYFLILRTLYMKKNIYHLQNTLKHVPSFNQGGHLMINSLPIQNKLKFTRS